jgi:sigma-B regulation protein RsbU (phosphoserine phosphatase)
LGVAIGVFVVGLLIYIYFQEDNVKQETMLRAEMQLTEQISEAEKLLIGDTTLTDKEKTDSVMHIIQRIKPYKHSFCILLDANGHYLLHPDSSLTVYDKDSATIAKRPTIFQRARLTNDTALDSLGRKMLNGEKGMMEILKGKDYSMAVYRPLQPTDWSVALVCSRLDVFASLIHIVWFAGIAVALGVLMMFVLCVIAIRRITKPLDQLTQSTSEISRGNLHVEMPELKREDEMWQLRESFVHMQQSLREHIDQLTQTTAANERIKSELSIANNIQQSMMPKTHQPLPDRSDIDIYASLVPAKEVGGDLFDYYLYHNKLCFIVGDVSGKGIPAALYMAMTMRVFRIACRHHINSAHEIAEAMGRTLAENNESNMFITAFIGVLDLETNKLGYCNAGHNQPLMVYPDGHCSLLQSESNIPLGILEHFDYEGDSMDFLVGTKMLVYTDGLTEAENPQKKQFGEEQLIHTVEDLTFLSSREIVTTLDSKVRHFANGAEQSDDLTILCISKQAPKRTLFITNEMSEVTKLKQFMEGAAREFGIPDDIQLSLNLAVEEAVVNVINYAYPKGTEGDIEINITNSPIPDLSESSTEVIFTIIDQGVPFDPTTHDEADTTSELEERQIGGLGIHLIRNIMDRVEYQRDGNSNKLTMTKILN